MLCVLLQQGPDSQAQAVDPFAPRFNNRVMACAVLSNGQVLLGGEFTEASGRRSRRLELFDQEGIAIAAFDPEIAGGEQSTVTSIAVQPDGRILIAGTFSGVSGHPRGNIARLNPDGTVDASFNPFANDFINPIVIESQGTILVGGRFSSIRGQPRAGLARLLANGTVDASFNPGADSSVRSIAVDSQGRILVGGGFEHLGGSARRFIGRLNTSGVLDAAFAPEQESPVEVLAVLPDDSILVGGSTLRRIKSDGQMDPRFEIGLGEAGQAVSVAVQVNGQILVGGRFNRLGLHNRNSIGRLSPDGVVDPLFNPNADGGVLSLALQNDGGLLVGGEFQRLGGVARGFAGRLSNPDAAVESLEVDGRTLRWVRGGSCPEVSQTVFEHTEDGVNWRLLGAGARGPGGWMLDVSSLPESGTVRARGQVSGGIFNGSHWFVESRRSAPWPLQLRVVWTDTRARMTWNGGQAPFQVQESTELNEPQAWRDVGPALNSRAASIARTSTTRYLRVVSR